MTAPKRISWPAAARCAHIAPCRFIALVAGVLGGCTSGSPAARCVPNDIQACTCGDGRSSFHVCDRQGLSYTECNCPIGTEKEVKLSVDPSISVFSFANMAPGETATHAMTVSNEGASRLRYAVRTISTEDVLSHQLQLRAVLASDTQCTSAGTALYGPGPAASRSGINIVGDPTQGGQSGDREIDKGGKDVLCLTVSLPIETDNSFQGLSTSIAIVFSAEQVLDNP